VTSYDFHQKSAPLLICRGCLKAFYVTHAETRPQPFTCQECTK
jgi:hypothetical protein